MVNIVNFISCVFYIIFKNRIGKFQTLRRAIRNSITMIREGIKTALLWIQVFRGGDIFLNIWMMKLRKVRPGWWRASISGREKNKCIRFAFEELGRRSSRGSPSNIFIWDDLYEKGKALWAKKAVWIFF